MDTMAMNTGVGIGTAMTMEKKGRKGRGKSETTRKCLICGTGEVGYPYMHSECMEGKKNEVVQKVYSKYKQCRKNETGMQGVFECIWKTLREDKLKIAESAINSKDERLEEIRGYIREDAERTREVLGKKEISLVSVEGNKVYQYRREFRRWCKEEFEVNKEGMWMLMHLSGNIPKLYLGNAKQVIDWECKRNGLKQMEGWYGVIGLIGDTENFELTDYGELRVQDIVTRKEQGAEYLRCVWKYINNN